MKSMKEEGIIFYDNGSKWFQAKLNNRRDKASGCVRPISKVGIYREIYVSSCWGFLFVCSVDYFTDILQQTWPTRAVASNRQTEALALVIFLSLIFCSHVYSHHKHPNYLEREWNLSEHCLSHHFFMHFASVITLLWLWPCLPSCEMMEWL